MSENAESLILSLETILYDSQFKISRLKTTVNASRDSPNNANLPAFLYKCKTMNLLQVIMQFTAMSNLRWTHFKTKKVQKESGFTVTSNMGVSFLSLMSIQPVLI